jgi:pSer/pThr/pTyr-binding forkhead associated (FHA) protein
MIQLNILSGGKAGLQWNTRRLPVHIGRASGNELQLEDDGVWDQHLTLEFRRQEGFTLATAPDALVTVNNRPVQTTLLHNGDIITLGSAKFQFWLSPARQRSLPTGEFLVWALVTLVTFVQFVLIYRLIR